MLEESASMSTSLPLDVIVIVAESLALSGWHGTCAALNVTSRLVQAQTSRILWRTVVLRCSRDVSVDVRDSERCQALFRSTSSEYIEYLIILFSWPSTLVNQAPTWSPPGIQNLSSKPNRLKVCLVASTEPISNSSDRVPSQIWILLFDKYEPCSTDMLKVMEYTTLVRKQSRLHCRIGIIRPCLNHHVQDEKTPEPSPLDAQGMPNLFTLNKQRIASLSHRPASFTECRLLLPLNDTLPKAYASRLMADLLTWQDPASVYCCVQCAKEANGVQERYSVGQKRLLVWNADDTSGVEICKALRAAYAFDAEFASLNIRIITPRPLAATRAKTLLRILQRQYLEAAPNFAGGGTSSGQVMVTDNVVVGVLHFFHLGDELWAFREIHGPGQPLPNHERIYRKRDGEASSEESDAE